jgi:hypothetical protein
MRLRKPSLIALSSQFLWVGLFFGSPEFAWSAITLQRVQNTESGRVDLVFDGKVNPQAIRTEFFNDTIQLSLDGVNVYPAKISNYSGQDFQKIFAYQYAPGLVRCRFTMKSKAEDYQDQFKLSPDGKVLSIRFGDKKGAAQAKASGATRTGTEELKSQDSISQVHARAVSPKKAEKNSDEKIISADERTLLQKVLGVGHDDISPVDSDAGKVAVAANQKVQESEKNPKKISSTSLSEKGPATAAARLGGAPELPSPVRAIAGLIAICSGLGLLVLLKKGRGGTFLKKLEKNSGFQSILGNLGLKQSSQLIEVLSNHSLGPRKSIAVVRIGGQRLVLGVTNEAIHLITQLEGGDTSRNPGTQSNAQRDEAALSLAFGTAAGAATSNLGRKGRRPTALAQEELEAFDLEALARESVESPELFRPGAFGSDMHSSGQMDGAASRMGDGATAARSAHGLEPALAGRGRATSETQEPTLAKSSAIRDRIRSRLGSMKQI